MTGKPSIVIFHVGRCGSTVLSSLLAKQGDWCANSEIFENSEIKKGVKCGHIDPIELMSEKRSSALQGNRAYSCEMKYLPGTHLDIIGLNKNDTVATFREIGFSHFVLLYRKNFLDRLISQAVAVSRKSYVRRREDDAELGMIEFPINKICVGPYTYNIEGAFKMLQRATDEMRVALDANNAPFIELNYEDHIRDDANRAVAAIADFVNFPAKRVEPDILRIVTRTKAEILQNYDAVAARLDGTPYVEMLK